MAQTTKSSPVQEPEWLTINEVMEFLRASRTTVYRLLGKDLPFYRMGRHLRVARADVLNYMKSAKAE